jgi:hypothetical protein
VIFHDGNTAIIKEEPQLGLNIKPFRGVSDGSAVSSNAFHSPSLDHAKIEPSPASSATEVLTDSARSETLPVSAMPMCVIK